MEPSDYGERSVDYYVNYQGDVHRLVASTNRTTATLVHVSSGTTDWEIVGALDAHGSRTRRGQSRGEQFLDDPRSRGGRPPSFEANRAPEEGRYAVYRDGQPYEVTVEPETGPRFWLFVLVPVFLLGVLAVAIGAIGYRLSATAGPPPFSLESRRCSDRHH